MTARSEVLAALAVMAMAVAPAVPAVAAQDCSIGRDGWGDIGRFRRCLEEYNPDRWGDPWLSHAAFGATCNPTIVRLPLQKGWDRNAPVDGGRSPLRHGARNTKQIVGSHLLEVGAGVNARDALAACSHRYGFRRRAYLRAPQGDGPHRGIACVSSPRSPIQSDLGPK